MRHGPASALLAAALLATTALGAQELPATAPITAVTVYLDRAQVTRTVEATLGTGTQAVVVPDLPASVIEGTLRVEPLAGSPVTILGIESRVRPVVELVRDRERDLVAQIERLQDRLRTLDEAKRAQTVQLNFVERLGDALRERAAGDIRTAVPDPGIWRQTWEALRTGGADALAAIHEADNERRTVERELDQKKRELQQLKTGERALTEVTVRLDAASPGTARLRLTYQVPGASWRPSYEARLDGDAGRLRLVAAAQVSQSSGETWRGVALTLATSRPSDYRPLPELQPWLIDVIEPEPPQPKFSARQAAPSAEMMAPSPAPPRTLAAQVVTTELSAEYRVPGTVEVPADGAEHRLTLAEREVPAEVSVKAVPRIDREPHLRASFTYPGPEPWLPGPVMLFRDQAFVGQGELGQGRPLSPGQEIQLGFGTDEKVEVKYQLENGGRSSEGIIRNYKRIERVYRIEVTSHHARPMPVTVVDQLPVPQDERIKVELLRDATLPTQNDLEGRRGVVAWTKTLSPGEAWQVRFGYAVTYPAELNVTGF